MLSNCSNTTFFEINYKSFSLLVCYVEINCIVKTQKYYNMWEEVITLTLRDLLLTRERKNHVGEFQLYGF